MKYLSLQFIDSNVLWVLAACLGAGLPLWYFRTLRRTAAILLTAAALLLVVGIPAWRDSLASLASTPKALAVMTFASLIALVTFGVHIHSARRHRDVIRDPETREKIRNPAGPHKDHYHHRVTVLLGILAGTLGGVTVLDIPNVTKNLSKAPGGTGSALRDAQHQVTSGQAAHLAHAGGVPPLAVIAIGGAVVLVLYKLMGRHRHVQEDNIAVARERQARERQISAVKPAGREGGKGGRRAARPAIGSAPQGIAGGSRRGPGHAAAGGQPQGFTGEIARRG